MARPATIDDAIEATETVRQSILSLCAADHQNDQATVEHWLANKNPETFVAWIGDHENFCAVEEVNGRVRGVGLVRKSGQVLLFYMSPGFQRRGLGQQAPRPMPSQAGRLRYRRGVAHYRRQLFRFLIRPLPDPASRGSRTKLPTSELHAGVSNLVGASDVWVAGE